MPIMLAGMWCLSTGGRNASKVVVCMRVAWCLEDVSMRGLVVPIGGSRELYWEPWGIWGPWEPIREAVLPVDGVGAPIGEASVRLIGRARATRGVVASMKGAMAPMREAPGACAGWCLCGGLWSLDPVCQLGIQRAWSE